MYNRWTSLERFTERTDFALENRSVQSNFPSDFFETATALARKANAPLSIVIPTLLVAVSALHSDVATVRGLKEKDTPLSTYVLIAAKTGVGKSSALNAVFSPFYEWQQRHEKDQDLLVADYNVRNELWTAKRDNIRKMVRKFGLAEDQSALDLIAELFNSRPVIKKPPRILLTETTLAGLKDALGTNHPIVIQNADASEFIKSVLLKHTSSFCSAWSAEPIAITNRHLSISANKPLISMILMTQHRYADEFMEPNHEFRESGLGARFLYFDQHQMGGNFSIYEDVHPSRIDNWISMVNRQLDRRLKENFCNDDQDRKRLRLTEESKSYLEVREREFHRYAQSPSSLQSVGDIAVRAIEHILRLAGIFTLFSEPEALIIPHDYIEKSFSIIFGYLEYVKNLTNPNTPRRSIIKKSQAILNYLSVQSRLQFFQVPMVNGVNQGFWGITMGRFQSTNPIRGKSNWIEPVELLEHLGRVKRMRLPVWEGGYLPSGQQKFVEREVIQVLNREPVPEAI